MPDEIIKQPLHLLPEKEAYQDSDRLIGVTPGSGAGFGISFNKLYALLLTKLNFAPSTFTPENPGFWGNLVVNGKVNTIAALNFLAARVNILDNASQDTTAPTLSAVSVSDIGQTSAIFNVQSDEDATVYWAVYPSATAQKTKSEILAGTGAVVFGAKGLLANDLGSALMSPLAAGTPYKVHYFGEDAQDNETTAAMTATFTTTSANTTPAAPSITANDTTNTLQATHALGASEILVSVNNGAYTQYDGAVIQVGDVARAAGYWKFKVKAATGRNESPVASSPAFTANPTFNRTLQMGATENSDGVYLNAEPGLQFKFNAETPVASSSSYQISLFFGSTQIGVVDYNETYNGDACAIVYNGTTYTKTFVNGNLTINA